MPTLSDAYALPGHYPLPQWPRCYYEDMHRHLVSLKGRVEEALYVMERIYNTMFGCVVAECGTSGEHCKGRIYCDATTTTVYSPARCCSVLLFPRSLTTHKSMDADASDARPALVHRAFRPT